jgi:hypothetical protein
MRHENKWTPAVVVQHHSSPRSYILQTQSGKCYRRNRRHIRPTSAQISERPKTDDPIVFSPDIDILCTPNTDIAPQEKPMPEVEPSEQP